MQDIRFAFRTLRNNPGFTLVVMATLGLGIGINTAIFSVVNGVLLRPLPYTEPDDIMTLWEANPQLDVAQDQVAALTFLDWVDRSQSFASLGAYNLESYVLGGLGKGEPLPVSGAQISPAIFEVVDAQPALGRAFQEEEATPGNDFVVILSNSLWTQRFEADRDVIGTVLYLGKAPYTVVGVMPPDFQFPPAGRQSTARARRRRVVSCRLVRRYETRCFWAIFFPSDYLRLRRRRKVGIAPARRFSA